MHLLCLDIHCFWDYLFLCFKSVFAVFGTICFCVLKVFLKKIEFFSYFKLIFFVFSDYFDILMSKINFFKIKKFILIHFQAKNTLKNNRYHTFKHRLHGSAIITQPQVKLLQQSVSNKNICSTQI